MTSRWTRFAALLALPLAVSFSARAQNSAAMPKSGAAPKSAVPAANAPFSPRDIFGVWNSRIPTNASQEEIIAYVSQFGKGNPPMTAWAQPKYDASKPSFGPRSVLLAQTNDPVYKCYPPGVPRVYLHPFPFEFVDGKKEILQIFEYDHMVRHIFMDGRPVPTDPELTWLGYSVGHWDGDTLVVETVGFNDKTWLDRVGHPHSDKMKVTERFTRTDGRTLKVDLHIEDPVAYKAPIDSTLFFTLHPDWDIMEQVCMDNISFEHFEDGGKTAEKK